MLFKWCWRRLLRVPWTARRANQSILKETSPEYSLEGLTVKLKLQQFGHLMRKTWLIWKDPDAGKDWGQEEKGMSEDEMVGWHHWLNGHGFGWTPGFGDGQGGLACFGWWGHKESDMTEWLNWTELTCRNDPVDHCYLKHGQCKGELVPELFVTCMTREAQKLTTDI